MPKTLGKAGEERTRDYLAGKGYKILAQNYRSPFGEVDLICQDEKEIVFVEVKTRSSSAFGEGLEAVNFKKQEKIIRTAQYFLKKKGIKNLPFRFDVISILSKEITHIPHAFP